MILMLDELKNMMISWFQNFGFCYGVLKNWSALIWVSEKLFLDFAFSRSFGTRVRENTTWLELITRREYVRAVWKLAKKKWPHESNFDGSFMERTAAC